MYTEKDMDFYNDLAKVKVQTGDSFCSASPQLLGRIIIVVTAWLSSDGHAKYGHSGVIINDKGDTIEALWRVKSRNIYDNFKGKPLVIARPVLDLTGTPITPERKKFAIKKILLDHHRKMYPWWRVPLQIIPPLARRLATRKHVVCSELTAKDLYLVGSRHNQYPGTTPDQLSDEFHHWKQYEIIYEGIG